MKDSTFFLKEVQHLNSLILKAQLLQKDYPEDDAIPFMIAQYKFRKNEMHSLYESLLQEEQRHNIQFAIKTEQQSLPVPDFLDYLKNFWSILKNTYANLFKKDVKNFNLNFDTTFLGSFGIQLSTKRDETKHLFGENTQDTMDFFFSIAEWVDSFENIDSNRNITDIKITVTQLNEIFKGNIVLAKRYIFFYKKIHEKNNNLEIKWRSSNRNKSIFIDAKKIAYFIHIAEEAEKNNVENIEFTGLIKGVSLLKNTIEFVPDNQKYKHRKIDAIFDPIQSEPVKNALDKTVTALFEKKYEINENEDAVKEKFRLISLSAQPT